jgi:hypothetical protein
MWLHRHKGKISAGMTVHRALWLLKTSNSANEYGEEVYLTRVAYIAKHVLCQEDHILGSRLLDS